MKKTLLKIGSIIVSIIPGVTLIACNGNQDNPNNSGDSDNNDKTINEYVPNHNKNEYPNYDNEKNLDADLSDYAWKFYNLKGRNYFKNNPKIKYPNRWTKNETFVEFIWGTGTATKSAVFNFYELYDYAHNQDLKIHYPDYDSYSDKNKKIAENNNSFPYLKNN